MSLVCQARSLLAELQQLGMHGTRGKIDIKIAPERKIIFG